MSSYTIHEWFEILLLVAARNVAEDLKQVHDPVEGLHLGGNLRNPRGRGPGSCHNCLDKATGKHLGDPGESHGTYFLEP